MTTRQTRASMIRSGEWGHLLYLDMTISTVARCPECMALPGETCRTWEAVTPEPRVPHVARMARYDEVLDLT